MFINYSSCTSNIWLKTGRKDKWSVLTIENCTADAFVRYSDFVKGKKLAFHRGKPLAPRLHGSVHVNLIPSLVVDCILVSNAIKGVDQLSGGSNSTLSWLLATFFSLCCSYCLVLFIPPTAPVMRTVSRRVSHTLLSD